MISNATLAARDPLLAVARQVTRQPASDRYVYDRLRALSPRLRQRVHRVLARSPYVAFRVDDTTDGAVEALWCMPPLEELPSDVADVVQGTLDGQPDAPLTPGPIPFVWLGHTAPLWRPTFSAFPAESTSLTDAAMRAISGLADLLATLDQGSQDLPGSHFSRRSTGCYDDLFEEQSDGSLTLRPFVAHVCGWASELASRLAPASIRGRYGIRFAPSAAAIASTSAALRIELVAVNVDSTATGQASGSGAAAENRYRTDELADDLRIWVEITVRQTIDLIDRLVALLWSRDNAVADAELRGDTPHADDIAGRREAIAVAMAPNDPAPLAALVGPGAGERVHPR